MTPIGAGEFLVDAPGGGYPRRHPSYSKSSGMSNPAVTTTRIKATHPGNHSPERYENIWRNPTTSVKRQSHHFRRDVSTSPPFRPLTRTESDRRSPGRRHRCAAAGRLATVPAMLPRMAVAAWRSGQLAAVHPAPPLRVEHPGDLRQLSATMSSSVHCRIICGMSPILPHRAG